MKVVAISVFLGLSFASLAQNRSEYQYPNTRRGSESDVYFDLKVDDPYRWLEDDRSAETAAWVIAQNETTAKYLERVSFKDEIRNRLEKKMNYEKVSAPFVRGNYTYYYKNNGLQNQSVLFQIDKNGNEKVFLDPNTFAKDGTTSLGDVSFSPDGSLVAYSISEGGSDWRKIRVIDVETRKPIGNELIDVKFSGVSWYKNEGFYYSSYDKPKGSELSAKTDQHKLYYHKLKEPQSKDKLIFGEEIKRRYVGGYVTEDQRYLFISAANSTSGNELYFIDLNSKERKIVSLQSGFDYDLDVLDTEGNYAIASTNKDAPTVRVVRIDLQNPTKSWKTIIEATENVLSASTAGGYLFASYLKDANTVVYKHDYSGKLLEEIKLPGLGTASGFSAKKKETTLYYSFTNYITPGAIYQLDIKEGTSQLFKAPKVNFNSENYVSEQVFYTSKDGEKIPMTITYRKDLVRDGNNPTILYGYGGFNISLTPQFSPTVAVWLEMGGIYAVANIRGGGEYGKRWHDGGRQFKKQNVFDDFIAAAEYLVQAKYTSPQRLALRGGSNGGLLVGAVMTQRPDVAKVAIPAVGVLDMLRYHTFTAGAGWAYDYGTVADSKEMAAYLFKYSPVHNVRAGVQYPATMILTGDHDDRVVPAHSFKFAAELQSKQSGENPTLIRIATNAGHGAGTPLAKVIDETTDVYAFILHNFGFNKMPK